jgi:prevent-host-death family protein
MSDNLISMKRISATEAARNFADVLDRVEQTGETFVIERRGRTVAQISTPPKGNAYEIAALLKGAPFEDTAIEQINAVRDLLDDRTPSWDD